MIHRQDHESLAVLRIEHGKANAVDVQLFEELGAELDRLEQDEARAIVLTGTGRIFSAGVDLFQVLDGGKDYLDRFLPVLSSTLERLFCFPKPVVAAINGHALAGGCVLACACDRRIMAEGKGKIGVTELAVGVPFPAAALEVFRRLLPTPKAEELIYGGRMLNPKEAQTLGLVDELAPEDELLARAEAAARALAKVPAGTFALTKTQLRQHCLGRIRALEATEEEIRQMWARPEMLATIRAFLDKTVGKK